MITSVPNFNFLAQLVTEIWRGSQNKSGRCWSPQTLPSDQIFICEHSTCKCLPAYPISTFQLD